MNENILLECRKVVMGYDGAAVVNSVSFELERGDYLCIVGENGSGKSTLLKGILGAYSPARRQRRVFGRTEAHGHRLSAAADAGSARFSGDGARGRALGLPQRLKGSVLFPAPTEIWRTKTWRNSP